MAKVSRDLLKDLVKECLVEILSEGLSSSNDAEQGYISENKGLPSSRTKARQVRKGPGLLSFNGNAPEKENPRKEKQKNALIEKRIRQASGGNNIMESILRDTAENTLPNMLAGDQKGASNEMVQRMTRGDQATKAMATADPMDIFEGSSRWASLAFSGKNKTNEK